MGFKARERGWYDISMKDIRVSLKAAIALQDRTFLTGCMVTIFILGFSAILIYYVTKDYNCRDFSSQSAAQSLLNRTPGDPYKLDADKDGFACEQS